MAICLKVKESTLFSRHTLKRVHFRKFCATSWLDRGRELAFTKYLYWSTQYSRIVRKHLAIKFKQIWHRNFVVSIFRALWYKISYKLDYIIYTEGWYNSLLITFVLNLRIDEINFKILIFYHFINKQCALIVQNDVFNQHGFLRVRALEY